MDNKLPKAWTKCGLNKEGKTKDTHIHLKEKIKGRERIWWRKGENGGKRTNVDVQVAFSALAKVVYIGVGGRSNREDMNIGLGSAVAAAGEWIRRRRRSSYSEEPRFGGGVMIVDEEGGSHAYPRKNSAVGCRSSSSSRGKAAVGAGWCRHLDAWLLRLGFTNSLLFLQFSKPSAAHSSFHFSSLILLRPDSVGVLGRVRKVSTTTRESRKL